MDHAQMYIQHQLNHSKTKQAHKFSKAARFPKTNRITQTIYNIPNTNNKKTTTFGYGKKISFSLNKCTVAPGTYNTCSQFQKKNYDKTPTIYQGRQKCVFGSFLLQALKRNKHNPSPDRYDIREMKSIIGGNIGERIKTQDNYKQKNIPGPGSYDLNKIQIGCKGNYILSTFKNTKSPRYHSVCRTEIRGKNNNKSTTSVIQFQNQGKKGRNISDRSFNNNKAISFSKAKRLGLQDRNKFYIPGFKYKRFSQFGIIS